MYLVVNVTKRTITLSDLKITLLGNQMADLDKCKKTILEPEKSKDLRLAVKQGRMRVLQHDRKDKVVVEKIIEKESPKENIQEMLRNIIKEELSSIKNNNSENKEVIIEKNNPEEITSAINELKDILKNNVISAGKTNIEKDYTEEDNQFIDESKLIDIHAKALNKIQKSTDTKMKYDEDKVDDSDFEDNLSMLEDLDI